MRFFTSFARKSVALFALAGFVVANGSDARAQFDIPGIIRNNASNAASAAAEKAFANALKLQAPIVDPDTLQFPTVTSLPGGQFRANVAITGEHGAPVIIDPRNRAAQIALLKSPTGTVHLAPGDYTFPMSTFCMRASGHSPSGHQYVLARLQGRVAQTITRMNSLAARHPEIPHSKIQVLSWTLQTGTSYAELPSDMQATLDSLDPSLKDSLSQDYLQSAHDSYASTLGHVPGAPSYEQAVSHLGPIGDQINALTASRGVLRAYRGDYGALSQLFVPPAPSAALSYTPWSRLEPGVYARYLTPSNYGGHGSYEVRVIDTSLRSRRIKHCPNPPLKNHAPCPPALGGGGAGGGGANGGGDGGGGTGDGTGAGGDNGTGGGTGAGGDNGAGDTGTGAGDTGTGAGGNGNGFGGDGGGRSSDGGADVPIGSTVAAPNDGSVQPLSFGGLGWGPGGPDFIQVTGSAPLFDLPVSGTVGITVDRFGGTYVTVGLGFPPGWGAGINAGAVSGLGPPTHDGISNALSGWSVGGSLQPGGAGGITANPSWSAPSGQGTPGVGISTPGLYGVNVGYTWDITPSNGCCK